MGAPVSDQITVLFGVLGALLVLVGALAWWFMWAPTPDKPDLAVRETSETLTVDGRVRRYVTIVPDGLPANAPLWMVLNGANNTIPQIRAFTGYRIEELAVRHAFAVVYAEGYEETWHDCRTATPYPARIDGIDDVSFLESLVGTVTSRHQVDRARVYGFGYSNGSHMLFRMAAERPGTFAGIVANAANLPAEGNNECAPWSVPVPVMLVEGTGDPINPYEGVQAGMFGQNLGQVRSAERSASCWPRSTGSRASPPPPAAPASPSPSTAPARHTRCAGTRSKTAATPYRTRRPGCRASWEAPPRTSTRPRPL